jgi:parallel beta-helix repeat protein
VELVRTTFDGHAFGFGRNFPPIDGPAELTYYFRVGSTTEEVLTAVGGNNAYGQVAWWVGVGGDVGNAIGTHTISGGWNHVMAVSADTWYGVTLEIDPASFTYDITVWEDGNPGNTATETGIAFRDGTEVEVIDQIQFGNFSDAGAGPAASAFVDDVEFVGARVLNDDFETGNVGSWSWSTRPRTAVTTCYQTVTTDAYLANDLICDSGGFEWVGVELGASNIFLDLNGHSISGHVGGIGVRAMNVDGVTIKNGTIKEYSVGMDIVYSDGATVRDLYINELIEDDPQWFRMGMRITTSQDVLVRDSFFEFLRVAHKEAIVVATADVTIDNIEVKNASVGVNYGGACDDVLPRSSGTVVNSRFVEVNISGVLAQCTNNALITENEFDNNEMGIDVYGPDDTTIVGLTIEGNYIHDCFLGIKFHGNTDCSILNNVIRDNFQIGINLTKNHLCPEVHEPGCFYATRNLISGNEVTGSFIDLYHHELATGNTWTGNTCLTKEGTEIPACTPPGP